MLFLPRNNDLIHHNKNNISLKIINDIETKASYFFKNHVDNNNIVFKETCCKATKRKRDSLVSLLKKSRKISNKIQRIDASCSPIIKKNKCVRFNLSATTVHDLGRISFSGAYSRTASPINTKTTIQLEELIVNTSSLKKQADADQLIEESMWYNRTELRQMKYKAYSLSKSVQQHLDTELTESYNKCSEMINYKSNDIILLRRLFESNKLNDFILQRGLERWSSKGLSFERTTDLVLCKTNFFLEQSEQMISNSRDPIKLAIICSTHSIKSNHFAQLLALIDAHYV